MTSRLPSVSVLALAAVLVSCGQSTDLPPAEGAFTLVSFSPNVLLPGTKLVITGEGFRANEPMKLTFLGDVTSTSGEVTAVDDFLVPVVDSGTAIHAEVTHALLDAAGEGEFSGRLGVEVVRDGVTQAAVFTVVLGLARELVPSLTGASSSAIYFGDRVKVTGKGFLLGGREGATEIVATGDFFGDDGSEVPIDDYVLATTVTDRGELVYVHTPELFGLRTGEFQGTLTPRNLHRAGATRDGAALPIAVVILQSSLAALAPAQASRQQKIRLGGHGFFESVSDGVATELRLEGSFTPDAGAAHSMTLDLPVKVDAPDAATWVLAPQILEDQLVGFGAQTGRFTGKITPVLSMGAKELRGQSWQGTFRVLPTRQVVWLKFTQNFTNALHENFGLRNVDRQVKDRVFEVARRDYAGFNIEFREEKPTDFAHYTVLELIGDDPNEVDLFGLDNTDGKDLGNLRLNDYVGGANAEQVENGAFAYGGVFVASFLRFSPNVCRKEKDGIRVFVACNDGNKLPIKTPRFDEIFGAFAPLLGGSEARLDELEGGPRSAKLQEAIRVLGNLAGNTCVHELGHSLGLAQEIGTDEFHNAGDTAGLIMNPGGARPFAERAETSDSYQGYPDPLPHAEWAPGDRAYLEEILPVVE